MKKSVSNMTFYNQPNNTVSCWMAVTNMIIEHYLGYTPYTWTDMNVNLNTGDSITEIDNILSANDEIWRMATIGDSLTELENSINNGHPVVAVVEYVNHPNSYHAIVIAGYDNNLNKIYILDPACNVPHWCKYTIANNTLTFSSNRNPFKLYELYAYPLN